MIQTRKLAAVLVSRSLLAPFKVEEAKSALDGKGYFALAME
jgi:hypothetical protein